MGTRITVSLVEDDTELRHIWERKLKSEPDFELTGSYERAETALAALRDKPGDLVVVDWKLPGMDGVELIRQLKHIHPGVHTILITSYDLVELPFAAFAAGADGFLLKPVPLGEFTKRLREVRDGKCPVSAAVAKLLVERLRSVGALQSPVALAPMEVSVLELFAEGLDTKTVAARLGIAFSTVVTHKRRVFDKLHAHNLASALRLWSHPAPPPPPA